MGNFSFGKKSNYKGSSRPSMHKAVCSKCGKDCEVPFKPTGDKPIYCSDCFKNRPNMDSRRGDRKDFRRSGSGGKKMYKAVCSKCGKDCEVPFRPTGDKPVYCSNCFEKSDSGLGRSSDRGSGQTEKQLEMLNNKLDKIIELLAPSTSGKETKEIKEKKVVEKAISEKTKKVAKKALKKPAKKKPTTKKKK